MSTGGKITKKKAKKAVKITKNEKNGKLKWNKKKLTK